MRNIRTIVFDPNRKMLHIRSLTLVLGALAVLLVTFFGGIMLGQSMSGPNPQVATSPDVADSGKTTKETLAGTVALLQAENKALRKEILSLQHQLQRTQERVHLLNAIVADGRIKKHRIVQVHAFLATGKIHCSVLLVKGQRWPKKLAGNLRFYALSDHQRIPLKSTQGATRLPYEVENHTFISGEFPWRGEQKPQALIVQMMSLKGKLLDEKSVPLRDGT